MLLYNILLAFVWCWLMGDFSAPNVFGGFTLGFAVLALLSKRGIVASDGYLRKVPRVLALTAFFLYELVVANIRLAVDLLTPGSKLHPAILAMPLEAKSDAEITLLASLVTLTPGTLSMDVSPDRSTLYIHALYAQDPEALLQSIKKGFEARILEILR